MGGKVTKRTPEERKAQAEGLQASIVDQVQQLADSGAWRRFLDFARSFHSYSLNNLLLILAQDPDASMVAGFRQWQARGRQVRKGEKSIKIFGFREKKVTGTEEDTDAALDVIGTDERVIRIFPILSVFDIAQTDPIEGADEMPENPTRQLTGTDDHGVIGPLTAHLQAAGWTVGREPMTRASGYTDPDTSRVMLADGIAPEQAAKTLIHEAAHIHLGHVADVDEYRAHRGRMEVEAESVAYIVAGLIGFDTAAFSIGYITGWADEDTDVIRDTAARVLKAAHTIAEILTPADEEAA